jgi:hypothetical protein
VDSLGEDTVAKQVQSMLIAALVESGRFVVTENRESADAILKGVASETSSKDYHASSDSFSAQANGSVATASGSGGHAATSRSDSSAYTETTYIARLSIRLVNSSGDILWATTQETTESRNRPISSELATKATRLLVRDSEHSAQGMPRTASAQPQQLGLAAATKILISVKGDKAMETEIAKKLLAWGKLSIVPSVGEADLILEVTQTGKYDGIRGTGVTAAAELKESENGKVLWSTTKGGSWSMSGFSTRSVARQIGDELIKFVEQNSELK